MNNEIQIFSNEDFGEIRTIEKDGKVLFLGSDVAKSLGYSNTRDALARHCRSVVKHDVPHPQSPEKMLEMSFIPEGDVYRLITHSKLPDAERFESWVFDEVLPTIRKTGGYVNDDELFVDTYLSGESEEVKNIFRASLMAMRHQKEIITEQGERIGELEGRVEQQRQTIEDYQPKIDYLDTILACSDAVTTTQIAADYDISANRLNKILHEEGLQRKVGDQWILYHRHMGKGYTKSETIYIKHQGSRPKVAMQTKWTQKGRVAIYEILKSRGIVPKMDMDEQNV